MIQVQCMFARGFALSTAPSCSVRVPGCALPGSQAEPLYIYAGIHAVKSEANFLLALSPPNLLHGPRIQTNQIAGLAVPVQDDAQQHAVARHLPLL